MATKRSVKKKVKAQPVRPVKIVRKVVKSDQTVAMMASGLRERVHTFVSVRKQELQARRGSYRAAVNPRSRNATPMGGSGDTQVDSWSRRYLRELSRDMDRNADTFRILNDAFAAAIVGEGAKYRPTTSDNEWNKIAARVVHEFMLRDKGGLDVREMRSGYKIQFDAIRAFAVDGETGAIKLNGTKLQAFESEQLTDSGAITSTHVDGISMDGAGRIVKYKIAPYGTNGSLAFTEADEWDPEDVEWIANRSRFSQTRGVPLLVASLDDWERLDSYRESEIIAAEQGSQIYGVIEHPEGDLGTQSPFQSSSAVNPSTMLNGGLNQENNAVDWQPSVAGALLDMPNGKKYVPVDPARPNRDAVPFLLELVRQFCANAGLPYEWVYNDIRGLSWSVNRALVQMARDRIAIWQTQIFGPWMRNIYRWVIAGLIKSGKLPKNKEWENFEIAWPQISWPDEGAEYEAQERGLLKGLTTRHRLHGPHWRDFMDERAIELDYATELAVAHNSKYPEFEVNPMFFLGFEKDDTPKGAEPEPDEELNPPGKKPKKENHRG